MLRSPIAVMTVKTFERDTGSHFCLTFLGPLSSNYYRATIFISWTSTLFLLLGWLLISQCSEQCFILSATAEGFCDTGFGVIKFSHLLQTPSIILEKSFQTALLACEEAELKEFCFPPWPFSAAMRVWVGEGPALGTFVQNLAQWGPGDLVFPCLTKAEKKKTRHCIPM